MVYHHLYDNPEFRRFNIEGKAFSGYLHYARKGAVQFNCPVTGPHLLPENHFQVYFSTRNNQEFELNSHAKYSLLSFEFPSSCLAPLRSYSPLVNRFLDKASEKSVALLFSKPQLVTPESKRMINSVFFESWNNDHTGYMIRLVLLPALRNPERHPLIMTVPNNDPVHAIAEWIIMHLDEPISIPLLAQKFLMNEFKLKFDFKKAFGVPVITFVRKARIERAKQLLRKPDISIANVARMVGFIHTGYFSDFFRRETGISPSGYRKKPATGGIAASGDRA